MIHKIYTFKKIKVLVLILAALTILSGCFFGTTVEKTVTPTIRVVGLPTESIIDSITLKVTGPDMDPVEVSYSQLPNVINIAIPEGNNMTFELNVGLSNTFIANPAITYTSLKGTATASINSDSAVVTLNMGVGSTKIIVPDYQNSCILQFDDISYTTSVSLDLESLNIQLGTNNLSLLSVFDPYDIDFDSQGRIYIANYDASEGIIRVDNIYGLNPHALGIGMQVVALTVDRVNNLIYYTNGNNVWVNNFDGSNQQPVNGVGGESSITGLTVDNGYLFLIDSGSIIKYNISTEESIYSDVSQLSNPLDVLIKKDKLYIANSNAENGYQILELSTSDLSLTGHYGNSVSSVSTTKKDFYGPRRFVAQMNEEITIIDDSPDYQLDKIIQMDNIKGDNWNTLPGSGPGQDLFKFFDDNAGE